ncbi:hypothetical protein [Ralstonia solanacearum]|uniref:hypothetical protein n=1 Tax=Ralstonia pseudosolanacearum TaxID=1310165 RepID=UPI001E5D1406
MQIALGFGAAQRVHASINTTPQPEQTLIGTLPREEAACELREIQQPMLNLIDDARSVLSAGDIGGKRGWMDQISAALFGDYGSGSKGSLQDIIEEIENG